MVDDTLRKMRSMAHNVIRVPEYVEETITGPDDNNSVMESLLFYITGAVRAQCSDVREYVKSVEFKVMDPMVLTLMLAQQQHELQDTHPSSAAAPAPAGDAPSEADPIAKLAAQMQALGTSEPAVASQSKCKSSGGAANTQAGIQTDTNRGRENFETVADAMDLETEEVFCIRQRRRAGAGA